MRSHAILATATALPLLLFAGACADDDDANAGRPEETAEEAVDDSTLAVTTEEVCQADVEPTYLPWLSDGDEPIPPSEPPFGIEGQVVVQWFENETDDSALLQLIIDTNPRPSIVGGDGGAVSDEPIGIFIGEVEGEFGVNHFRGGHFLWELQQSGCTSIGLSLWLDLPEDEVREELARIARSLVPVN